MKNKGPLYVLTCYVIWGLLPIFWKLLAQVDSLYVLASRIVWSMVLTGGILLLRRDRLAGVRAAFRDRREWGLLAAAGCVVCVNWGVYIWAVANGHMIDSSLAYYMNPILAILLGTVLFRERLTKLQWLAVAVTFAGLVITVIRYRQIPWIALVIGGSFAVYGALKKQVRSDAAVSTFVETLTLAPFALVLIFWMETHGTGRRRGPLWLAVAAAAGVRRGDHCAADVLRRRHEDHANDPLRHSDVYQPHHAAAAVRGAVWRGIHRHPRHFVRLRLDRADPVPDLRRPREPEAPRGGKTMRVITGTARGRRLKELEGTETRPTTDPG